VTDEEVQAIIALTQRFDTFLERMGERDVQREQRLTRLEVTAHRSGDCPAIIEVTKTVNKLWDGRNKLLGLAAGIGVTSSLGTAGILRLLGG